MNHARGVAVPLHTALRLFSLGVPMDRLAVTFTFLLKVGVYCTVWCTVALLYDSFELDVTSDQRAVRLIT
jgi:hypothetical protein